MRIAAGYCAVFMGNPGAGKEGIILPDNVFDGNANKDAVYNICWAVKSKSAY